MHFENIIMYCNTKEVTPQIVQNCRDLPKINILKHVSFDFQPSQVLKEP